MTIKEYVIKHKIYGGNIRSRGWKLKHQAIMKARYQRGEIIPVKGTRESVLAAREKIKEIDMAAVHSKTDSNWWKQFTPEERQSEMKARWDRIYKRNPELKDAQRARASIQGLKNRKYPKK
jgi:hypothetical protein